ncbi:Hypothetical protein NTJ_07781 [Nesidiocoris tenuis]|uniref:Uncharacterized protein n=1 Tax=Nesidiocoris tenuis TaxID=355587 RepID=A0ABN7AWX2_9HEMI|nr:Hypothetical protein NTJ_07781 [Nesidiocoris tenuis]
MKISNVIMEEMNGKEWGFWAARDAGKVDSLPVGEAVYHNSGYGHYSRAAGRCAVWRGSASFQLLGPGTTDQAPSTSAVFAVCSALLSYLLQPSSSFAQFPSSSFRGQPLFTLSFRFSSSD